MRKRKEERRKKKEKKEKRKKKKKKNWKMIKRVNVKNLKKNEHYIYKNISNEYTL